jgi:hypothetical protein
MLRMRTACCVAAVMIILICTAAFGWPDVKVNQDTDLSVQNEASVVVNRYFTSDSLNVVAAYNDMGKTLGVSWSSDGGVNWSDVQLPYVWSITGDPSVACDPSGNAYACFLSYEGSWFYGVSGIYVSKSTDGGRTWAYPDTVDQLKYASGSPVKFADKCMMKVDTNMASPYVGNVYVGWQRDDPNGLNSDIFFARSTDGGLTFTTPIQVNDNPPQTALAEGAFPFVSANGTVYMTWYDCYFKGGAPGSLWVDISTNGGLSFGTDKKVANFTAPLLYTCDCTAFRAKCFPSAAADPYDPSKLYITYISDPDGYQDLRIDVGDDPGQAASALYDSPDIAREGNNVYVAWDDFRNGTGGSDIYFNRSTDNGMTWQMISTGPLDNTDTPGANTSWLTKVSSSGANVYAVWEDYRWAGGGSDVYFNNSTDYGATWQTEQNIDGYLPSVSSTPEIASTGNYVYIVWTDSRSGMNDIYFNRSTNGGASWSGAIRIDNGDSPGADHSVSPRVTCTGSLVYCMWLDDRAGGGVYFNRSTDYGATWQNPSARVDAGSSTVRSFGRLSSLRCAGTNVYACWTDDRTGTSEVYFNRSTNSGISWTGSVQACDGGANCAVPTLEVAGNYVYLAWHDDRMAGSYLYDVFFDYSSDFGATWHSDIGPLDPGGIAMMSDGVVIKADGSKVYATWRDDRNGTGDIYFNRSTDNGVTWLGEAHLNLGTSPFQLQLNLPIMSAGNGWVNVIWPDPRCIYMGSGQQDIFANCSSDYGATWLSGPDEADVFCVRSTDGGITWQAPVTVSDNPETYPDLLPWVAVKSNGLVDIAYYQFETSPLLPPAPASRVRMAVSSDAGASFGASFPIQDLEVFPTTKWVGEYIGISVIDSFAYTAFTDLLQTGNSDVFIDRAVNPSGSGGYTCGDADGSSAVDIDDVVYLIAYIFAGGPPPSPIAAGDADCSGAIDIDDVVYLISYIFSGGHSPCDPNGDGIPDC